MPRLVALLLAAAATAASAESDENNFTAASADEGRVKKYAAQSYDWLADRAPAAKAFAAQAAAQASPAKAKAVPAPSPKPVTKPRQPSVTVRPVTKKMASDPSMKSTDLSAAARPRRVSV